MKRGRTRERASFPVTKPHCFFAHIAFALDARAHASPQATANLIIEISDTTLTSCGDKKHVKVFGVDGFSKNAIGW